MINAMMKQDTDVETWQEEDGTHVCVLVYPWEPVEYTADGLQRVNMAMGRGTTKEAAMSEAIQKQWS